MGEVISATTRFLRRGGQSGEFLEKASFLMTQAEYYRREGDLSMALECAYRAALRIAGAVISDSSVAKKRSKPRGAWEQLKLVDTNSAKWAAEFSGYSRIRARVCSGLSVALSDQLVEELIVKVQNFFTDVEQRTLSETGLLSDVA